MLMGDADAHLLRLGQLLKAAGYHFTTVTPETHRRVVERKPHLGATLRDIFGWNYPFAREALPEPIWEAVCKADVVRPDGDVYRSTVRFATVHRELFVHSSYPTQEREAVFLGPDTYRFVRALRTYAPHAYHAVDVGCGTGAGGLCLQDRVRKITLADINVRALRYAAVNSVLSGCGAVHVCESNILAGVPTPYDLVVANPPYIVDTEQRMYRNGGGQYGIQLAVSMTEAAMRDLAPGGTLIMYTGTPVVDGLHVFWRQVEDLVRSEAESFHCEEIDPDVFGEELERPCYASVERMAVVLLRVKKRS